MTNPLNIAIKSMRATLEMTDVHSEPEIIPQICYKLSADIICVNSEVDISHQGKQDLTHSKNEPNPLFPRKK